MSGGYNYASGWPILEEKEVKFTVDDVKILLTSFKPLSFLAMPLAASISL